jgi:hypothetical protein
MFPIAPIIVVVTYFGFALFGAVIGLFGGWLLSLVTKCGPQGFLKNAGLGALGFLMGFLGCVLLPYPRNTINYQLEGGVVVTSTMNRYQHPYGVAIVMAVFLPLIHEVYRLRQTRKN